MKKIAAGATATVFAVAGLSAMAVAPAQAAPFANCTAAYEAGYSHILSTSDKYAGDLDRDKDGVGCETPPAGFVPAGSGGQTVTTPQVPETPEAGQLLQEGPWAYDNCTDARAAGAVNIPAGTPGYGLHLDRDRDGFGCDADVDGEVVADDEVVVGDPGHMTDEVVPGGSQIVEVPAGGADTGVPVEKSMSGAELAGAGALGLAALAGAGLLVRRAAKA